MEHSSPWVSNSSRDEVICSDKSWSVALRHCEFWVSQHSFIASLRPLSYLYTQITYFSCKNSSEMMVSLTLYFVGDSTRQVILGNIACGEVLCSNLSWRKRMRLYMSSWGNVLDKLFCCSILLFVCTSAYQRCLRSHAVYSACKWGMVPIEDTPCGVNSYWLDAAILAVLDWSLTKWVPLRCFSTGCFACLSRHQHSFDAPGTDGPLISADLYTMQCVCFYASTTYFSFQTVITISTIRWNVYI